LALWATAPAGGPDDRWITARSACAILRETIRDGR
jgi:hypothetical protein